MGKYKLRKFRENETFRCLVQPATSEVLNCDHPLKGNWGRDFFGNDKPIVLELGCGKGDYTVDLAERNPAFNYIGIDIKGARLWKGAKYATEHNLTNVGFLRTRIEFIESLFAPGEVSEIWITFPDPQMQKTRRRLTSTRFLELYRKILRANGLIHLKTDSPFLYTYTSRLVKLNNFPTEADTDDLYGSGMADPVLSIKTFYEQQWLSRGKTIKFISFNPLRDTALQEPEEDDIERDDYHSYPRGIVQGMNPATD